MILGHGFGGTVDAGLQAYARAFADAGWHAVLFDYRGFGSSGGKLRQHVSATAQLQDWHAAIGWARSKAAIAADQIALWGVSLSGGHVVEVAARDDRVAAVIAQFPMLDGAAAVLNIGRYAGVRQLARLLVAGLRDTLSRLGGGSSVMIPIVAPPGGFAALAAFEAESGYRAIAPPGWRNEVCGGITLTVPFYRPGKRLKRIRVPVLIQIADSDSILPVSSIERFVNRSTDAVQAKHYPCGHFDAFVEAMFETAVGDQIAFIRNHLEGGNHEEKPAQ